jgi:hypothetical protein
MFASWVSDEEVGGYRTFFTSEGPDLYWDGARHRIAAPKPCRLKSAPTSQCAASAPQTKLFEVTAAARRRIRRERASSSARRLSRWLPSYSLGVIPRRFVKYL